MRSTVLLVLLVSPLIILLLTAWAVPMGDFAPVEPRPELPDAMIAAVTPEAQVEPHTCGWHAIRSVYRAYGVAPTQRRLRARLGVDNRAFLYDDTSTGSLHPDIYRVLDQDGFASTAIDPGHARADDDLDAHLTAGHPALALIIRRETGVMHWVVITEATPDTLTLADSLAAAPYPEARDAFWAERVLSVLLVRPRSTATDAPLWRLHLAGVWDMWRAFRRAP